MNIKKIYKYRLIIVLAIIAGIMGLVKWQYRNTKWEEVSRVITPTVMPSSAPETNEDYPLWELLPYAGSSFVIDHYIEPLVLSIKTEKGGEEEKIVAEIFEWMKENKVATESHKLVFEKGN